MKQKPALRIHPHPTKKDIKFRIVFNLIIAVLGIIAFVYTLKDQLWGFSAIILILYGFFVKTFGVGIIDDIWAYHQQHLFRESSRFTKAIISEKNWIKTEKEERSAYYSYTFTILFTADTSSKGVQEQSLYIDVPYTLYRNASETIGVRYSTLNPRIALLDGEEDFYEGEPSNIQSLETYPLAEEKPLAKSVHKKTGIKVVERFLISGEYQFYKIYAENHVLYGARIRSQDGIDHDPDKGAYFYNEHELITNESLVEGKYNFRYSFEEIKNIRLIDKKLNYNSIPYRGRLIVNLLYGKKRSFLVSSNIDHAKAILETAGFSLG